MSGVITLYPRFDDSELQMQSFERFDYKESRFGIWNLKPDYR